MVICLERGADLHMVQLMPLPLTVSCFSKIQVLSFWYRFIRVVPDEGPLNGRVCVQCVYKPFSVRVKKRFHKLCRARKVSMMVKTIQQ